MKDMDIEYKPFSTADQIKDFVEHSPIWKDMETEMKIWLSEIHMLLENLDGTVSHRDMDRLGGSAEAVRNLSNFPHVLLINVDAGKRKEKVSGRRK
jgi:hypothetical protein